MSDISADAQELARRLTETLNQYADRGMSPEDSLAGMAYFFANFQLSIPEGPTFRFLQLVRECTEQLLKAEGARNVVLFPTNKRN